MARADRRRVTRAKPAVAAGSSSRARDVSSYEDEMFFVRLRRHAKWMFVFLALVFGLGFVIFGVGSDTGTGIGDLFRDGASSGDSVSVSDARERVAANPRDAAAKRDLAIALQTEGETNEAIVVLGDYLNLRPKDEDALRELAALYLTKASARQRDAQIAQLNASYATLAPTFAPGLQVAEGQSIAPDPIVEALATRANEVVSAAYGDAQEAYTSATQTYERLVELAPRDPNVQLELAQTAQQAGDYPKAISAYERFLELAPDDPTAPLVKEQVKQLQAAQQPGEAG
jgi:tetratricopeptide (TPR) repeat protein